MSDKSQQGTMHGEWGKGYPEGQIPSEAPRSRDEFFMMLDKSVSDYAGLIFSDAAKRSVLANRLRDKSLSNEQRMEILFKAVAFLVDGAKL